jgi:glucosamine--fructose-6-phosphate aminotransferase (isomerizing)
VCGIVGYCGSDPALPIILASLQRLEYRGYDSAGVAVINPTGAVAVRKSAGKLHDLKAAVKSGLPGTIGIGHTRWATHGKPNEPNAHPHTDGSGRVAVVHNGIVENYRDLKEGLADKGKEFVSETDSEVIPHLIADFMTAGFSLEAAMRQTGRLLAGAHAIVAVSADEPDRIVGMRIGHSGGLAVGYGKNATFLASDLPAIAEAAGEVLYLEAGEVATVTGSGARITDMDGGEVKRHRQPVAHDPAAAAKGPYKHFMMKEMMEQPETLISALRDRIDFERMRIVLDGFPFSADQVRAFDRVVVLGMGTSFNSAQVGRLMIERLARLPAEVDNSAEFRYRDPVIGPSTLIVSVGQSGETVDTLVAMKEAKERGASEITICNVSGSEAIRLADYSLIINAGPEIAVASTKTFLGSMACLYLLAIHLGVLRGELSDEQVKGLIEDVVHLPTLVGDALSSPTDYPALARKFAHNSDFLILGRGINYPTAMEGALKLKELSYIHAEGYQGGEMKHGPIALIDDQMPVAAIALKDRLYDKMMNHVDQVKARDGRLIIIATEGDELVREKTPDVIYVPPVSELLSPIVAVVPLQLLAYHIAVRRGADVDQPRNLAKTVTVE